MQLCTLAIWNAHWTFIATNLASAEHSSQIGTPSPWIVYIQIAPGRFIELFPGGHGENKLGQIGYNHFCLLVEDMDATLKELAARGLPIDGKPIQGLDNNWQYWIQDPDGNRIELMQITADSPQAAADASWH